MVNHYGIHVDPKEAVTGVFQLNNLEFIWEDVEVNGIDLVAEEHYDNCEQYKEEGFCDCDLESCDHLVGFYKDDATKMFEPFKGAEYSAIVRGDSNVIQVLKSKWGIRCALCSPCYPGQGDGDTPGDYLAYSVPPDVVGDYGDQELKKRIFLLEEVK
jgi:hypothetical protein